MKKFKVAAIAGLIAAGLLAAPSVASAASPSDSATQSVASAQQSLSDAQAAQSAAQAKLDEAQKAYDAARAAAKNTRQTVLDQEAAQKTGEVTQAAKDANLAAQAAAQQATKELTAAKNAAGGNAEDPAVQAAQAKFDAAKAAAQQARNVVKAQEAAKKNGVSEEATNANIAAMAAAQQATEALTSAKNAVANRTKDVAAAQAKLNSEEQASHGGATQPSDEQIAQDRTAAQLNEAIDNLGNAVDAFENLAATRDLPNEGEINKVIAEGIQMYQDAKAGKYSPEEINTAAQVATDLKNAARDGANSASVEKAFNELKKIQNNILAEKKAKEDAAAKEESASKVETAGTKAADSETVVPTDTIDSAKSALATTGTDSLAVTAATVIFALIGGVSALVRKFAL